MAGTIGTRPGTIARCRGRIGPDCGAIGMSVGTVGADAGAISTRRGTAGTGRGATGTGDGRAPRAGGKRDISWDNQNAAWDNWHRRLGNGNGPWDNWNACWNNCPKTDSDWGRNCSLWMGFGPVPVAGVSEVKDDETVSTSSHISRDEGPTEAPRLACSRPAASTHHHWPFTTCHLRDGICPRSGPESVDRHRESGKDMVRVKKKKKWWMSGRTPALRKSPCGLTAPVRAAQSGFHPSPSCGSCSSACG